MKIMIFLRLMPRMKIPSHILYQLLAANIALLPLFLMGICESWTSVYIPQLLDGDPIKITSEEGSWIAVFLGVGGVVGSLLSPIANKIGRKPTMLVTAVPYVASFLLLAFADSVVLFCVSRFIVGVATGLTWPVTPLYVGEISHPKIRGAIGTYMYIVNTFGFLLINILGTYLSIRITAFMLFGLTLVFVAAFIWMPESFYYLIKANKLEEAKKSLEKFKQKDEIDKEFIRLQEAVKEQVENSTNLMDILRVKSNRRALLILFFILMGKQLTGDIPTDAYAQTIFDEISDVVSPTIMSVIYYLTKLTAVIVSGFLIEKVGRKSLYLVSLFSAGLSLSAVGAYLYIKLETSVTIDFAVKCVAIVILLAFAISYCLLASVPVIILSEIFPMNVKPYATVSFGITFFASMLIETKYFQATSDAFGMYVPFFTFSASCFIHCIIVYFIAFETKGKTLEEIQEILRQYD